MSYRHLLRPLLFSIDAERAHEFGVKTLGHLGSIPFVRRKMEAHYGVGGHHLKKQLFGLEFPNPLGIAAGLDKNAIAFQGLAALGAGFVEIGTVTPRPQKGNAKPRLFRLPEDRAILNRMGFNNDGAERIAERLKEQKGKRPLIGGNIGKNKDTPNQEAASDHAACMDLLHSYVDYWVINISSPNTPGLRDLQEKDTLRRILGETLESRDAFTDPKPLLVKLSPDLENKTLDDMLDIFREESPDGLIVTNTTVQREGLTTSEDKLKHLGAGGISGDPLRSRSDGMIRYVKEGLGASMPVIGVGGIMNASDALAKLDAGADLIQVYTGLIYEGPALMKKILRDILARQEVSQKQD